MGPRLGAVQAGASEPVVMSDTNRCNLTAAAVAAATAAGCMQPGPRTRGGCASGPLSSSSSPSRRSEAASTRAHGACLYCVQAANSCGSVHGGDATEGWQDGQLASWVAAAGTCSPAGSGFGGAGAARRPQRSCMRRAPRTSQPGGHDGSRGALVAVSHPTSNSSKTSSSNTCSSEQRHACSRSPSDSV